MGNGMKPKRGGEEVLGRFGGSGVERWFKWRGRGSEKEGGRTSISGELLYPWNGAGYEKKEIKKKTTPRRMKIEEIPKRPLRRPGNLGKEFQSVQRRQGSRGINSKLTTPSGSMKPTKKAQKRGRDF